MSDLPLQHGPLQLSDLRGDPRRVRKDAIVRGLLTAAAVVSIAHQRRHRLVPGPRDLHLRHAGRLVHGPARPTAGSRARACTTSARSSSAASWVTVIAMLVAVPVGLGAAIYLSEYARPRVRKVAEAHPRDPGRHPQRRARLLRHQRHLAVDRAAVLRRPTSSTWLAAGHRRRHPHHPARGVGVRGRPARPCRHALREACYGMGARKITTVTRVVIPAAVSGLVAAFILAVSRAIGETMVVFIAGGAAGGQACSAQPARAGPHDDRRHGHAGPGHRPGRRRGPHLPEPLLRRLGAVPHHARAQPASPAASCAGCGRPTDEPLALTTLAAGGQAAADAVRDQLTGGKARRQGGWSSGCCSSPRSACRIARPGRRCFIDVGTDGLPRALHDSGRVFLTGRPAHEAPTRPASFQAIRGTFWIGVFVVVLVVPDRASAPAVYLEEYADDSRLSPVHRRQHPQPGRRAVDRLRHPRPHHLRQGAAAA